MTESKRILFQWQSYHNLYLEFADLQVVFIVHVHPFQCTAQTLMVPHQKHYGKTPCKSWRDWKNAFKL